MIGIGATLFKVPTMHWGAAFSPASLFAAGEEGSWYDPADLTTLFQNSNGTTAVAVGDPVGYMADKSGNGNHAIQATSDKRPTLQQDGSLYFLQFDGANDCLATSAIDFTGGDSMTVSAGLTRDDLDTSVVAELSATVTGNTGAFRLAAISTASGQFRYQSRGDGSAQQANATPFGTGKNVLTGVSDISSQVCTIRVDGTVEDTDTDSQGAGNYGNHPLNIGSRNNGASIPLNGDIYGLIVRGATSSAGELSNLEAYLAKKSGVTL